MASHRYIFLFHIFLVSKFCWAYKSLNLFSLFICVVLFVIPCRLQEVSDSLWPHGVYSPWNSPGQNTGVGNLSLLQGIFPTQGSNPGLPHCRWILYQLSHKRSPRILEWVACPFSCQSSQPRNGTGISWIACLFFTNWAIGSPDTMHRLL